MGATYQYVVTGHSTTGALVGFYSRLYPVGTLNWGYRRLMKMEPTFLVDKYHQLKFSGNVQISNFNPNVADSLQTTLGAQYPFYSRNAKINYRTLQMSALVTINFDKTATFMYHDGLHLKGTLPDHTYIDAITYPDMGDAYLVLNDTPDGYGNTWPAGWYVCASINYGIVELTWKYYAVNGVLKPKIVDPMGYNDLPTSGANYVAGNIYQVDYGDYDSNGVYQDSGWYKLVINSAYPSGKWLLYDIAESIREIWQSSGLWWVEDENNKTFQIFNTDLYSAA